MRYVRVHTIIFFLSSTVETYRRKNSNKSMFLLQTLSFSHPGIITKCRFPIAHKTVSYLMMNVTL